MTRVSALTLAASLALGAIAAVADPGVADPSQWPAQAPAIARDAKIETFIDDLLARMTVEEKVGQLIQADIAAVTPADLRAYPLGSILAGGNAAPGGDVRSPAASWLDLTEAFFDGAKAGANPAHPPIPLIFGIDAVHGHARIPGATVFPHNVGLGAAHDPDLIERIGRVTAEEVAATGIDWTFAPTVAVVRDGRWGRSYESYGEDPMLVASYARAMVTGLQGRLGTADFMAPGHTLASVKHYLGDGGTLAGRDQFDNRVSEQELRDVHGAPYPAALSAGALIVMASYNGWQGIKMHDNRSLLTGVLKERWSFPGFVVGDWNAQEEIPGCTKWSCPDALNAGLDMYMAPDGWKRLYANLLAQVRAGVVPASRLDDAVRRVLRVKVVAGLFGKASPKARPDAAALGRIGSAEHRAVAREAVRKSLVLLKNDRHLLPLDPRAHLLVTGPGADDIGMQSGGWTIDWQGAHNSNSDFPGGTSIYGGIRAAVERAGGSAELSTDGSYAHRPAAAIVVYGESPYAEFEGDRETLDFAASDAQHLPLLRRLRAAGIPVVSVFLSGRPLWVNPELNASDAFVAAWLPGSEGGGVADLLLRPVPGATRYDFTGRLSFSWPATADPVRYEGAGTVSGALFARGFGGTLTATPPVPHLAEDPRVAATRLDPDVLFAQGHVRAPWSLYVADAGAEVRVTMQSQASPANAVEAQLIDAGVSARWSGTERAEFRIGSRAQRYAELAARGAQVVARFRVDLPPAGPVRVGIRCEAPYGTRDAPAPAPRVNWTFCGTSHGALLDLTPVFTRAPTGTWQTLVLPLACLASAGADLGHVTSLFTVETAAPFAVSFSDVHIERKAANTGSCP